MALADTLQGVKNAVDAVSLFMPGNESAHLGEQWAYVASEFFSGGTNPEWTPAGIDAGRAAFAAAFGNTLPPDPTGAVLILKLQTAFKAFADLAAIPANAVPVSPPAQIPPIQPPPAPMAPITIPPPSDSTEPLAIEIFSKLIAWAPTGLVSIPNPAGAGPPVPTTPWS
tara:strand:- start:19534 stop:20040 length:507 start_codon:yes stop_codon:yes gene_type:complete